MKNLLVLLLLFFTIAPCCAQNSKKVKDMKNQKAAMQKKLKQSQDALAKNKKDVKKGEQNIKVLDREIVMRVEYIHRTEKELDSLERRAEILKAEIAVLDSTLKEKKAQFTRSLRMTQGMRKIKSSLLYALSAKDITQMYRRLRYTREYASYQRTLGEEVQQKQEELLQIQNELLQVKSETNRKMQDLIIERKKLSDQQASEKKNVQNLQQKQKGLQKDVNDQSRQIAALQKKIDEVIAYEIEQARKKAEEEARRKAEEERKRKEAQNKTKSNNKTGTTAGGTTKTDGNTKTGGTTTTNPSKWLTAEDQKLNGSFEQNKGKLPVPVTGPYMIAVGYGKNTTGKAHVTIQNKGVNYRVKAGSRARAVFDGEVSAVFTISGMKNVLVRHGSYITAYCNLSSVIVAKGQKVKARDLLGTVAEDSDGNYVLHFQLRKETAVLNPEVWISR